MAVKTISSPFGSETRTRVLLMLQLLGSSFPRELSRVLGSRVSVVSKALAGLERDALVSGRLTGRTQQEGAVTLTFERSGIAEREKESLRFVLPASGLGPNCRLRLEVTDKISGAAARVARVLTVEQRAGR